MRIPQKAIQDGQNYANRFCLEKICGIQADAASSGKYRIGLRSRAGHAKRLDLTHCVRVVRPLLEMLAEWISPG
jgi:hypothetical protein